MFSHPATVVGFGLLATLAAAGPCDIYNSGGTPCIAAHSTTRALFDAYTGGLYQVLRASDNTTKEITPVSAGGIADAGAHDDFCANTTCVITVIYDQSGTSNDLTPAPPGGAANGTGPNMYDLPADASAAAVKLNGQKVYGVKVNPGVGYRIDQAHGTATGDGAQGIYAIFDGTDFNDKCCFDYGNAELNNTDTGNGHMEALYFGNESSYGTGAGSGPWIMADLENGLFSEAELASNPNDPAITFRFVTAVLKGEPNQWSLRGGDATTGPLSTYWSGPRPADGYNPMSKEGSIILGIGGDNSNGAQGTFYEGIMTASYPSDDTENSVQENIVNAKYST